jgi:hypothetical protein
MNAGWIRTSLIPYSDRDHIIRIRTVAQIHDREGFRGAHLVPLVFGLAQMRHFVMFIILLPLQPDLPQHHHDIRVTRLGHIQHQRTKEERTLEFAACGVGEPPTPPFKPVPGTPMLAPPWALLPWD